MPPKKISKKEPAPPSSSSSDAEESNDEDTHSSNTTFQFGQRFGDSSLAFPSSAGPPTSPTTVVEDNNSKSTKIKDVVSEEVIGNIAGRVTLKSSLRSFSNSTTADGKVFTILIYDGTGEIACSLFRDDLYTDIQVNDCLQLKNARAKLNNPTFRRTEHTFELIVGYETVLNKVSSNNMPGIPFSFQDWTTVRSLPQDTLADIVVICVHAGDIAKLGPNNASKREITCIDKDQDKFIVTLWGDVAESFQPQDYLVIAIRNARVSNCNGIVYLNILSSSLFWVSPPIAEGRELLSWFNTHAKR